MSIPFENIQKSWIWKRLKSTDEKMRWASQNLKFFGSPPFRCHFQTKNNLHTISHAWKHPWGSVCRPRAHFKKEVGTGKRDNASNKKNLALLSFQLGNQVAILVMCWNHQNLPKKLKPSPKSEVVHQTQKPENFAEKCLRRTILALCCWLKNVTSTGKQ